MKDPNIVAAYDKIAPDPETAARILQNVKTLAAEEANGKVKSTLKRRILLVAACVALLAALTSAGYAAYQRWHLPEPEKIERVGKWGYLDEHSRVEYTAPPASDPMNPDAAEPASDPRSPDTDPAAPSTAEPISDEIFMSRALELLRTVGMKDVTPDSMTVVRQEDLRWDREEAVVSFIHNGLTTSVTYNAETGGLLGFYGFEYVLPEGSPCKTQEEADALAEACYQSLPVAQGYVRRYVEKYDSNFWCYDFCREVLPGLYSEYECVRVAVNPEKGVLTFCTVFDIPLLDDHQPGDEPLTQQQAEEAAMADEQFNYEHRMEDGWTMTSAEIQVCMPNWTYSGAYAADLKASRVTRLCWLLTYEKSFELFDSKWTVMVDLYTGEILGGDFFG